MRSIHSGLRRFLLLLLLLCAGLSVATTVTSCSDDAAVGSLEVSIDLAAPIRGHAPLEVDFRVAVANADADAELEVVWDFGDGTTRKGPAEVTHTYLEPGDYDVTVTVTGGDSEGTAATVINVRPSADLTVSGVQGQPGQLNSDEMFQVQFSISNLANPVEVPFSAVVFLSDTDRVDAGDVDNVTILDRVPIESFSGQDSGGSEDFQRSLSIPSSLPTGDYFVGVIVDADQTVGEVDEGNNVEVMASPIRIFNASTDGADLVVTQVAATPQSTRILSSITVDTTIENRGQRSAVNFTYAVFLSEDDVFDPDVDSFLINVPVTGISTGDLYQDTVFVPLPEPLTTPGEYWVFVLADPAGELPELNDNNNLTSALNPIEITEGDIVNSDIIVTNFNIDVTDTFVGGSVLTSTTIVNQGTEATGQFLCSVYLSSDQVLKLEEDNLISSFSVFNLAGSGEDGDERIIERPVTIRPETSPGDYWVFVFCDASGRVVEFDENNNAQRFVDPLSIGIESEVDLSIENISINPVSPLDSGADVSVNFDVRNTGTTSAGPSVVRLYLSEDDVADPNDVILFESLLPGLAADSSQTFQADVGVTCSPWIDNYHLLVSADVRNTVAELDDQNNTSFLEGGLEVRGERCNCLNDLVNEPNNFSNVATPLAEGLNEGFALCSGDTDWFKVTLAEGESLKVDLLYDPSFGELNLSLRDPTNGLLQQVAANDSINTVDTFLVTRPGDYLIQVRPEAAGARNYYDLDVTIIQQVAGAFDIAAVDIFTSTLAPEINDSFFVEGAIVNLGDQDVTAGDAFFVGVYLSSDRTIDPTSEDDITLGTFILNGINGQERIPFVEEVALPGNIASGDWYIGVIADVNDDVTGEADEANNVALSQALDIDTRCYDGLEPNDSVSDAATITPQTMDPAVGPNEVGLVVCKSNSDYYRIAAGANQQIRITTESDVTLGDLDLYLYSEQGTLLGKSETTEDIEEIFLPIVVGSQDIYLEVIQVNSDFNSSRSNYNLTVTMVDADSQLICNPEFEPNNSFEEAASLFDAAAMTQAIATCPDTDKDYYSFYLEAGTTVEISFDTVSTQLRAFLYENQQTLVNSYFNLPSTTISYTAPTSGDYFLLMSAEPGADREIEYGINIAGDVSGFDLLPINASMAPTTLSAGDALFYGFDALNQGAEASPTYDVVAEIATDMAFNSIVGTFDGPQDQAALAPQESAPINGKVILPLALDGTYYARVMLVPTPGPTELNGLNNATSSAIDVHPVCLPDDFEGAGTDNDAASRATSASVPETFNSASICPGDRDWYALTLATGESITLTATFTQATGDFSEDIDVFVYDDPSMAALAQGTSVDDDETVNFTAPTSGTYYVLVRGGTSASTNTYTLDIQ